MNVRICKCALFFIWQCVFTLCIYGHVSAVFLLFLKICFTLSRSVHIWCVETDHCSGWFLLNFPDGDFAVGPRGSAEHVAIFRRAQSLNAVVVCHQLLLHRVSIRVHHVDLPAGFPLAAHPDLVLDFDHADDAGAVFELDPDEGFVQVSVVPHTQLTCVCETRPQLLRLQSDSRHKPIHRDSNT